MVMEKPALTMNPCSELMALKDWKDLELNSLTLTLTPALSLGERENSLPRIGNMLALDLTRFKGSKREMVRGMLSRRSGRSGSSVWAKWKRLGSRAWSRWVKPKTEDDDEHEDEALARLGGRSSLVKPNAKRQQKGLFKPVHLVGSGFPTRRILTFWPCAAQCLKRPLARMRLVYSNMSESESYSSRFLEPAAAAAYDREEYGTGSYASHTWQWQQPVLEELVREVRRRRNGPARLLDFACGTGRVLGCVEPLVEVAEGVDISETMAAVARTKCPKAKVKVGDILSQPELLAESYDMVTAFRFLLNVEPALRRRILGRLRQVVREPEGVLVANIHGNSRSLRHPAILWRRWRERSRPAGTMLNEMSPAETRTLLRECGFRVVRQFGFGMLPPTLYRTPLRGPAAAVDKLLAGDKPWRNCSIDLLFVCEPC
jgi:SAM-dependent methyltransferase